MIEIKNNQVATSSVEINLLREGTPEPQVAADSEYELNRDIVFTPQYDLAEVSYRDAIVRNPTKKNEM
ncbi:MAG: hypothetical protein ACO3XO_07015 [Bdellovibrionota bacterium]